MGNPKITTCKKQWLIYYQLEKVHWFCLRSSTNPCLRLPDQTTVIWARQVQRLWWRLLKLRKSLPKIVKNMGVISTNHTFFALFTFCHPFVTTQKSTLSSRSWWKKRGPQSPTAACGRASAQQARSKTSRIFGCEIYIDLLRLFQQKKLSELFKTHNFWNPQGLEIGSKFDAVSSKGMFIHWTYKNLLQMVFRIQKRRVKKQLRGRKWVFGIQWPAWWGTWSRYVLRS